MKQSVSVGVLNGVKLLLILFVAFSLVVTQFSVQINWPYGVGSLTKGIYLHRFFADFFLYSALIVLLFARPLWLRVVAYIIAVAFTIAYFIQAQAYVVTGTFLPVIALENSDHADFLDTDNIVFAGVIWIVFLALAFSFVRRWVTPIEHWGARLICCVLFAILAVLAKNDKKWLSEETLAARFEFYNSGIPRFPPVSPISELNDTYQEYQAYLVRQNWIAENAGVLSERAAAYAREYYPEVGQHNNEYPLLRPAVYSKQPRFISSSDEKAEQPLNVIVFFLEGISTRIIQPYSDFFPGMSPNLDDFSKHGVRVDNYYNHAYATYRALGGQLCSMYALGRLFIETDYYCLGHVFKEEGYDTRFMVSQTLEKTDLDRVFRSAGFEQVDGSQELAPLLSITDPVETNILSDKQLIDGLIVRLKEHEESANKKPFLIGLYNFETHTGVKLRKGATYGPQKSYVLDTFHNIDVVFGEFWRYFKESPLYDNTVVIVTSDHATYPSRDYVDLVKRSKDYAPVFADEIPLIIYHPKAQQGVEFDARAATSLSFAPSLLHLMGISKKAVPFIGPSIFDEQATFSTPSASGGFVLWNKHTANHWIRVADGGKSELLKLVPDGVAQQEFMLYIQSLEQANRIWGEEKAE